MAQDRLRVPFFRLPYAPPRWPSADLLLFAAVGFVVASAAPLTVAVLLRVDEGTFHGLKPTPVLAPALFAGLLLALPMLNARSASGVVCVAVLGGPFAGALAGALTTLTLQALGVPSLALGECSLVGVPFGSGFGALLAGPSSAGVEHRFRQAHDGFDRLLITIGSWLSVFYGLAALALGRHELMILTWVGLAAGVSALVTGSLRQAKRKAWFERVRAGRETEWALRKWQALPNVMQLKPLFGKRAFDCDALLVHVARSPGGAYRAKPAETAVLLAPGPAPSD